MKTHLKLLRNTLLLLIIGSFSYAQPPEKDIITYEFPEAQQEIIETFGEIVQSLKDRDLDKLISFHGYGPKFTEFKDGEPRNGGEVNESFEREVFGAVTEVVKFDAKDLQIAVYGDVANVTFHSDFHLKFGEDLVIINEQITLLFVKTKKGWKIVHEHHSPLNPKSEN
ncbi:nuclear transport factor 2 family protein [uncultured Winogradskyella sp.]|uniref:YybH family protein n=1 Tax=uncultured Winogradskyella sp. TaxID=395353 RepID=UPI00262EC5F9|nr:nuclear transport factor 2 family protein [uncultured Winogradskyella sp.]